MKFPLSWLKEHLETEAGLDQLVDKLTAIGLEVEGVEDRAAGLAGFTVARVVDCTKHPDADKLTVCLVDTGSEQVQVVCGAPNARTGLIGVFAPSGSFIPGTGITLKAAKIRGVESNGMLLSEKELMISDDHEGIVELPGDAPLGAPCASVMGLDDPVIEIQIMPDRQDCLGVAGIARDLAAAGLGTVKPAPQPEVPGAFESPVKIWLDFPTGQEGACTLFAGRYIRGVRNGPSPKWLQDKLLAVGLRPISALVDVTNYLTMDRGRPLHVYDADKLDGDVGARLGKKGESFAALDGRAYQADETMTVIADAKKMLGLGGVIGGEETSCTENTVNVLIESALFDPARTAATGRKLGIESDARYRFERGVDPEGAIPGADFAAHLILEMCGGEASTPVMAGAVPDWKKTVRLRPARVGKLCNIEVEPREMARILGALGFGVEKADGGFSVAVPSWRRDIDGEADLIEEIARIHGYDRIESVPLPTGGRVAARAISLAHKRRTVARRLLAGRGLVEVVTWSFMLAANARLFGGGAKELTLANPISSELDCMRPSLLPNLIQAAARNVDRGFPEIALMEVGPQFADDSPEGQIEVAAGVRRGANAHRHWANEPRPVDLFDAKADALAVLEELGAPVAKLRTGDGAPDWYHPGRSGRLMLGPKNRLADFGEIHPRVLAQLGLDGPAVGFEVYLDALPAPKPRKTRSRPPLKASDLPAVDRDFAFVIDDGVPVEQLLRAIRGAAKDLIRNAEVFDVYRGEGVKAGCKSVAVMVRLEPTEKTLTEAEIEAAAKKIVAAAEKAVGATLRG